MGVTARHRLHRGRVARRRDRRGLRGLPRLLLGRPGTRAILLYVEAIVSAQKFMSAARAAARIKPVVVIKSGRHAPAAKAAATHTGALAGHDAVYEAAFRRAGSAASA